MTKLQFENKWKIEDLNELEWKKSNLKKRMNNFTLLMIHTKNFPTNFCSNAKRRLKYFLIFIIKL